MIASYHINTTETDETPTVLEEELARQDDQDDDFDDGGDRWKVETT